MRSYKNILTAIVIVAVLAVSSGLLWFFLSNRQQSFTQVTFRLNQVAGAKVQLYKGAKKDLVEPEYNTESTPVDIVAGSTLELQDWPYVVVVSGVDIQEEKRVIYPLQVPQVVTLSVARSRATLDQQQTIEKSAISSAIHSSNPLIQNLYEIHDIKLHGDGTWATAGLRYIGPDERNARDPLHVVVRKNTNSTWDIATKPQITTSRTPNLKDAPESVFLSTLPEVVLPSQGDTSH